MGVAAPLEASEFAQKVIQSTKPVLVDFWAAWCGPCIALGPTVDAVAAEYAGRVEVYKVDVEANNDLAVEHNVMQIPLLILFKNGKEVERLLGVSPKETIARILDKALI